LIVDLSGVESLTVAGLRTLIALADTCAQVRRPWALITNAMIEQVLNAARRVTRRYCALPAVGSMTAAREIIAMAAGCSSMTIAARDHTRC